MARLRKNEAKWVESRNRWQINEQMDGERKTFVSFKCTKVRDPKGKIDAERKADAWLQSKLKNRRLELLAADYLEDIKRRTPKNKGTAHYVKQEQLLRLWVLPNVGAKVSSKIRPQDWQDCITRAVRAGQSKKTLQNIRGAISGLRRYALKNEIELPSTELIDIPSDAPVAEHDILQPDALSILFTEDSITHYGRPQKCHYIHAWRMVVLTGMRRGEMCGLQRSDIHGARYKIARSINSLNEVTICKTPTARRAGKLNSYAQQVLDDQRAMLRQLGIVSPWLFPDEDGERSDPNRIYKQWYAYRKQHGITCSIHDLRRTWVSMMQYDMPEQMLKRTVGHTLKMDTYGHYGRAVDGEEEASAAIQDTVLERALGKKRVL